MQGGDANQNGVVDTNFANGLLERRETFSSIVEGVILNSLHQLRLIANGNTNTPPTVPSLLSLLEDTRGEILKLLVILKWGRVHTQSLQRTFELLKFVEQQDVYFRDCADSLYFGHTNLQSAKAPIYDVPTAIDVLTTHTYSRLPSCIETTIPPQPITSDQVTDTLSKLDQVLRLRLFATTIPSCFSSITITNGKAHCIAQDEFEIMITVDGERFTDHWRILSLEILVSTSKDETIIVHQAQLYHLRDLVQRRIATLENPLIEIYKILHTFCLSLQLTTLQHQAAALAREKTSLGNIHSEYNNEKKSLRIQYWIRESFKDELEDPSRDKTAPPSMNLMIDTEKDQLLMNHEPQLIDPRNSRPVNFKINPRNTNIEHLLLEVMRLHIYSRLKKLYDILLSEVSDCIKAELSPYSEDSNKIALKVSLVPGNCFLFISSELQTGRFLLKVEPFGSNEDYLLPFHDKLNKDIKEVRSIVLTLRHQKTLENYERLAYSLHLEPYQKWQSKFSKIPPNIGPGSSFLRFPEPYSSFFLLIELDLTCISKFYLVTTKKSSVISVLDIDQVHPIVDYHVEKRYSNQDSHNDLLNTLVSVLYACRKKISKMMVIQQFEEKKMKYKQINDGSILFFMTHKLMSIKNMVLSLSDTNWEVKVTEAESSVNIPPSLLSDTESKANCKISYLLSQHCWKFTYSSLPSNISIDMFTQDLEGVASILQLYHQWEKVNPQLYKHFKLENILPHQLIFRFEVSETVSIPLVITWRGEQGFHLSFTHLLVKHLETKLNLEKNIQILLRLIISSRTIYQITDSLTIKSEKELNRALPGDITLIPRSVSQLRLIYRNMFGLDIRFTSEDLVSIEDAYASLFNPSSNTTSLLPLSQFSIMLQRALQTCGVDHVPAPGLIPHHALGKLLECIHRFMGTYSLFRQVSLALSAEIEKDPASIKKDLKIEKFEIIFTIRGSEYRVTVVNFSLLELKVLKFEMEMDQALIERLSKYFREKVAAPPYFKDHITSFIHLLTLPSHVLKEFLKLIEFETEGTGTKSLFNIELVLRPTIFANVSLSFLHDKNSLRIGFILKLKFKSDPLEIFYIPLQYNYHTCKLSMWSMVEDKTYEKVKTFVESKGNQPLSVLIQNLTEQPLL